MPEKPPKPRLPDNLAAFDPLSHGRRKARWSLRPTQPNKLPSLHNFFYGQVPMPQNGRACV